MWGLLKTDIPTEISVKEQPCFAPTGIGCEASAGKAHALHALEIMAPAIDTSQDLGSSHQHRSISVLQNNL